MTYLYSVGDGDYWFGLEISDNVSIANGVGLQPEAFGYTGFEIAETFEDDTWGYTKPESYTSVSCILPLPLIFNDEREMKDYD